MARSLRRSKYQGATDTDVPKHILVPVRSEAPGLPKVNYSVPDSSFFRIDKRTDSVTAIVTVTPGDLKIGWDTCAQCGMSIRNCNCNGGISCPSSITHIFVLSGGVKPIPPQPLAVPFRSPAPRELKRSTPKRQLRRRRQEAEDTALAEQLMERNFKKLKRKKG